jgi:hypothetical protein
MNMIIIKRPEFENDDYLFRIDATKLPKAEEALSFLKKIDPFSADYYWTKRQAFLSGNIDPNIFSKFVHDKPSLRSLSTLDALDSTIYTVACERENNTSYQDILINVKKHLVEKQDTRRCMLRFANSYERYHISETARPLDVTCLSLIHYLSEGPKLIFRASDIKNELFVDILTINEFFIDPIYNCNFKNYQMSVYSSTAQGVSGWNNFVNLLLRSYNTAGENR